MCMYIGTVLRLLAAASSSAPDVLYLRWAQREGWFSWLEREREWRSLWIYSPLSLSLYSLSWSGRFFARIVSSRGANLDQRLMSYHSFLYSAHSPGLSCVVVPRIAADGFPLYCPAISLSLVTAFVYIPTLPVCSNAVLGKLG